MKILLVHPGARFSVGDVYEGFHPALETLGVEIIDYALDSRVDNSAEWLEFCWRRASTTNPQLEHPTIADVFYFAGNGAIERALRHQVDWVIIISAMFLHPDTIVLLRRAGLKVGLIFTESPYDDTEQIKRAKSVNICWTNERSSVERFQREGNLYTYYLPHSYDPVKHSPEISHSEFDLPSHDVVFVGTGFEERIQVLSEVDWEGIDLGVYGNWEMLSTDHKLRRYIRGGLVDNIATAELYRRARIGLSLHRTSVGFGFGTPKITHAESLNPRDCELAACGRFFVSDYRDEIVEVFEGLIPIFRTSDELGRIIRDSLQNDEYRRKVSLALPKKMIGRTFLDRASQLIANIEEVERNGYLPR